MPGSATTTPTLSSSASWPPSSTPGAGSRMIASTASPGDVVGSSHTEHLGPTDELTKPQQSHDHNRSALLNTRWLASPGRV